MFGTLLYRPTEYEVQACAKHAIRRNPEAQDAINSAAELVLSGLLDCDTALKRFICVAPNRADVFEILTAKSCTCADWRSKSLTLNGYPFCIHRIALLLYARVLGTHLRQRICGNIKFNNEAQHARANANQLLLFNQDGNAVCVYQVRTWRVPKEICRVRWSIDGTDFKSLADMHQFARWLSQAQPLAQDLLMPVMGLHTQPEDIFKSMKQQGFSDYAASMAADAMAMDEREWQQTYGYKPQHA